MARSQPGAGRERKQPVRTCIGCRERTTKPELVRVVAVEDENGSVLTPDLSGRAGGRGAHLHPTVACLDLAVRRKAFGRSLRVQGPLDESTLWAHVQQVESTRHEHHKTALDESVTDQKRSTRS